MLVISETARADMKEIWSYIAEYNTDSATDVIRDLAKKYDLLEANPKLGLEQDGLLVEMRFFRTELQHLLLPYRRRRRNLPHSARQKKHRGGV